MTDRLRLPLLAMAIALAPITAGAQLACIPPEEPYPFEPGDLDPELRPIVNDQYEEYVRKIGDHINCLEVERAEAMRSAQDQEVVQRWVRYFGEEAALRYDVGPDDISADRSIN